MSRDGATLILGGNHPTGWFSGFHNHGDHFRPLRVVKTPVPNGLTSWLKNGGDPI